MIYFDSDYMEGAHPEVMRRLMETNLEHTVGYGEDPHSANARQLIRQACQASNALVQFLVGGTQTNATVIDALLLRHQGVLAAETGHINVHESGAIESVIQVRGAPDLCSEAEPVRVAPGKTSHDGESLRIDVVQHKFLHRQCIPPVCHLFDQLRRVGAACAHNCKFHRFLHVISFLRLC